MPYLWLSVAIAAEVLGTTLLKKTEHFTVIVPSVLCVLAYAVSFYSLTLVLKFIPVGIAYAIWCGLGIVCVNLLAIAVYQQIPDMPAVIGMGLIVAGCLIINMFSKTAA